MIGYYIVMLILGFGLFLGFIMLYMIIKKIVLKFQDSIWIDDKGFFNGFFEIYVTKSESKSIIIIMVAISVIFIGVAIYKKLIM